MRGPITCYTTRDAPLLLLSLLFGLNGRFLRGTSLLLQVVVVVVFGEVPALGFPVPGDDS